MEDEKIVQPEAENSKEPADETVSNEPEVKTEELDEDKKQNKSDAKADKKHEKHRHKNKEAKLEAEIVELKQQLGEMQNKYYTAYADTENLKKRLMNDADTLRKYRIQSFATEILPAIDNLERALQVECTAENMKTYADGVSMIYQQLMSCLQKEGVTVIEAKDKPFDPKIHQALVTEKVEGVEPGIVLEEIQKGYMLKDRILRASLVKVSE